VKLAPCNHVDHFGAIGGIATPAAQAADRDELNRDARNALRNLYASNDVAKLIAPKSTAILVFPSIVKAGFMVGGQMGDGVLLRGGLSLGYYNSIAASYGLQAGVQVFGYALFFMNDEALSYLNKSDGWEVGVGPSVVVMDEGKAKSFTTTTAKDEVYAFIFSQKGLMAGIGLQGNKITKLSP